MWCKNCGVEQVSDTCSICGAQTYDIPISVYWCSKCQSPIILEQLEKIDNSDYHSNKTICPCCHDKDNNLSFMTADVRPVFPEERILLDVLSGAPVASNPESFLWISSASILYVDGISKRIHGSIYEKFLALADKEQCDIKDKILSLQADNSENSLFTKYQNAFNRNIKRFIKCNSMRRHKLRIEAEHFIINEYQKFSNTKFSRIMVSFSGGKDSTVVSDLVRKSLSAPDVLHVFGDTTLEIPDTYSYVESMHKEIPCLITVRNNKQQFLDMCEEIGPPSRVMRWCCTMFKTGPITTQIQKWFSNQRILTFYGVRHSESVSRSKYRRVESTNSSIKIAAQTVASPIIEWNDIDIWNYLLGEEVHFNPAYKKGFDRVGCWCCPNNTGRSAVLASIYLHEAYVRWRNFLVNFSKNVLKKPDAEVYVDTGKWKARQGGNNIALAKDVNVIAQDCTLEDDAYLFKLTKPMDESFYELFIPLGEQSLDLGNRLLKEIVFIDHRSKQRIFSIAPFTVPNQEYSVKVKIYQPERKAELRMKISYQIRKYNICRRCLKCESVCMFGAISLQDGYHIDANKCTRCQRCIMDKFITGGCLISKFLKTKGNNNEI